MGIDLYLHAVKNPGTPDEKTDSSEFAYVREGYGSFPFAVKVLCPETYWSGGWGTPKMVDEGQPRPDGPVEHPHDSSMFEWPEGVSVFRSIKMRTHTYELEKDGTTQMVTETFPTSTGIIYPAKVLRDRLPAALKAAEERYADDREWIPEHKKTLREFVKAAEKLEAKGYLPLVYNSY